MAHQRQLVEGSVREFDPAYAVFELYDDGRSARDPIVNYGA